MFTVLYRWCMNLLGGISNVVECSTKRMKAPVGSGKAMAGKTNHYE